MVDTNCWQLQETSFSFTISTPTKSLSIDKVTLKTSFDEPVFTASKQIYGLIGILNIFQSNYLVLVKERQLVYDVQLCADLKPQLVYEVKAVEFVPFEPITSEKQAKVGPILDKIQKYITAGFYFGFGTDLTKSYQRRHEAIDFRFMWNYGMCHQLFAQEIGLGWCVHLIQGYVDIQRPEPGVVMIMIARRQWKMGGTRYNARGIDDDGNVANQTETELIVILQNSQVFSHVQVRGSFPFFWSQQSVTSVETKGAVDMSIRPFIQHFKGLNNDYNGGTILCLNLVQNGHKNESMLSQRFAEILGICKLAQVEYIHFDFHVLCKANTQPLLDLVNKQLWPGYLESQQIYIEHQFQVYENEHTALKVHVESRQQGVIRTNCMDCLDRTNVAQQLISLRVFQHYLPKVNQPKFQECLVYLWAMAGDYISKQYSGTASVLTKVTLQGFQTIYDKVEQQMISVKRWQKQNLTDDFKQECILIMQGQHPECQSLSQSLAQVNSQNNQSIQSGSYKVQVVTFNVGGYLPSDHELKAVFGCVTSDIIVVGLQEVITSFGCLIGKRLSQAEERINQWRNNILIVLGPRYIFYLHQRMAGCAVLLFSKQQIRSQIKDLQVTKVKVQQKGIQNKGSVAISFKIDDTKFAFLNCHLEAGEGHFYKRVEMLSSIIQQAFNERRGFEASAIVFVFGDLNFRLSLDNAQARQAAATNQIEFLKQFDELLCLRSAIYLSVPQHVQSLSEELQSAIKNRSITNLLQSLLEGEIAFAPTYKFDVGTHQYDSSSKQRVPSYTDRILYLSNPKQLTQLSYRAVPSVTMSDHKPVVADFEVRTTKVDLKKLEFDYFNKF